LRGEIHGRQVTNGSRQTRKDTLMKCEVHDWFQEKQHKKKKTLGKRKGKARLGTPNEGR